MIKLSRGVFLAMKTKKTWKIEKFNNCLNTLDIEINDTKTVKADKDKLLDVKCAMLQDAYVYGVNHTKMIHFTVVDDVYTYVTTMNKKDKDVICSERGIYVDYTEDIVRDYEDRLYDIYRDYNIYLNDPAMTDSRGQHTKVNFCQRHQVDVDTLNYAIKFSENY